MKEQLTYIVYTDFDGTITVEDIGDKLFQHFGDGKECLRNFKLYTEGKVSARDCWKNSCKTLRSVSQSEFIDFAVQQEIDRYFPSFIKYCEEKNIPVQILSDGFDAYIDPILAQNGYGALPRFCNTLQFHSDGTIEPHFPFTDSECIQCANCKRNHLLSRTSDSQVIVYIGDGYSDRCPVQFADIVFAKNSLVAYCEAQNITYHRFVTFYDVLSVF
ncbi:MAG: MtnX-like HAD-IB family phosphatase [Bacteroidetes bacterium]|nr:MtnX-like HAD-IB family phosphatase [Bacteroidota bacterium]